MTVPRKRRYNDAYPPVACRKEDRAAVQRLAIAHDESEADWIRRAIALQRELDENREADPSSAGDSRKT